MSDAVFRRESAVEYFKDLVDDALAHQRINAGELTAFYVVNLLAGFLQRPIEDDDARVYIEAKRTIRAGEELSYDYRLSVPGRITAKMKEGYACRCGASRCRGTMLEKKKRR